MLDKFTASALREKTSIKSIIMMRYGLDLAKIHVYSLDASVLLF